MICYSKFQRSLFNFAAMRVRMCMHARARTHTHTHVQKEKTCKDHRNLRECSYRDHKTALQWLKKEWYAESLFIFLLFTKLF